jgi:hypothetical protein
MSEFGYSDVGGLQGRKVLKDARADHWSLGYNRGPTTFRALPVRSLDNPQAWDPYRFGLEPNNFGDWIRRYPGVRNMGANGNGVTFISIDPANPQAPDINSTPGAMLYNAINRAVDSGQERPGWAAMLKGARGRSAALSRPTDFWLCQCFLAQHGGKVYMPPKGFGENDKPIVMEISHQAGTTLMSELNRPRDGFQGDPNNWEESMACGDVVSLQTGRWITFYTLGEGDPRTQRNAQHSGWQQPQQMGMGQANNQQDSQAGYGCFVEPMFGQVSARLAEYEGIVQAKTMAWDDILWFPTLEEQAALLADKFPAEMIVYAWRDRQEWIPEAVKQRAVGAQQFGMYQGVPGQQQGWGALVPPAGPMMPGMMPNPGYPMGPQGMGGYPQQPAYGIDPYTGQSVPMAPPPPQVDPASIYGQPAPAGFSQPAPAPQPTMQAPPQGGGWGAPPAGMSHPAAPSVPMAPPAPTMVAPPVGGGWGAAPAQGSVPYTPPQAPPPQQMGPPMSGPPGMGGGWGAPPQAPPPQQAPPSAFVLVPGTPGAQHAMPPQGGPPAGMGGWVQQGNTAADPSVPSGMPAPTGPMVPPQGPPAGYQPPPQTMQAPPGPPPQAPQPPQMAPPAGPPPGYNPPPPPQAGAPNRAQAALAAAHAATGR